MHFVFTLNSIIIIIDVHSCFKCSKIAFSREYLFINFAGFIVVTWTVLICLSYKNEGLKVQFKTGKKEYLPGNHDFIIQINI